MYKLYGTPLARPSRCIWTLEEIGCAYELDPVMPGSQLSGEFGRINPTNKVPFFLHGDFHLFETGAICRYLATQHPEARLIPDHPQEVANFDRWLLFTIAEFEQPMWALAKHQFAIPKEYRIDLDKIKRWAHFEYERNLKTLQWGLNESGSYLCGSHVTVVDFILSMNIDWARNAGFDTSALDSYSAKVKDRPSFKKLKQIQNEHKSKSSQ